MLCYVMFIIICIIGIQCLFLLLHNHRHRFLDVCAVRTAVLCYLCLVIVVVAIWAFSSWLLSFSLVVRLLLNVCLSVCLFMYAASRSLYLSAYVCLLVTYVFRWCQFSIFILVIKIAMNWEKHCAHDWHDDDHFWSWFSINRNETLADHNVAYKPCIVLYLVHLDVEAYPNLVDDIEKQHRERKHYKHRILDVCLCVCARVHAQSVLTITKKKNLDWILFFSCSVSLCLFCSILDKWDLSVIASISPLAISYKYLRVRVCVWMFRKTKKSRLDNNPHFFLSRLSISFPHRRA